MGNQRKRNEAGPQSAPALESPEKTNSGSNGKGAASAPFYSADTLVRALRPVVEQFGLTPREQETTELLMLGLSSKEIASRMSISPNTVKTFLRLIMAKMGVTSRCGVVAKILTHAVGGGLKVS